ncbi:MAG: hypothetical protein AAGD07_11505 [Planctomycetota bacterium]
MTSNEQRSHSLPQSAGETPPAYGCIIYIRSLESGGVAARVANLTGLQIEARNEREALSKLVPLFRDRMAAAQAAGEVLELETNPAPPKEGEVKRFLPVHL